MGIILKNDSRERHVPINDLSRGIARDRIILEKAFAETLNSGYFVMGPKSMEFEKAFAEYLGVESVLGVASGTDALEIAVKAVMPEGKNSILTVANAGGYSTTAINRSGYKAKYADNDSDTQCLTLSTIIDSLDNSVGAVILTHLYGNLTDIVPIVEYCHEREIRVIEDCAQAVGAVRGGRYSGSFGDVGTFSFYPTKNLGALGDGGAVATNSPALAQKMSQLRQYGWSQKYHVDISSGTNSRLDELQAAFLLCRLPQVDNLNSRRREILESYRTASQGGPVRILPADGSHHVAHLAIGMTDRRDEVRSALLAQGIATDVHYPVPDHMQLGFSVGQMLLEGAETAARQVFSLPCFPELTDAEVEQVCTAIKSLA